MKRLSARAFGIILGSLVCSAVFAQDYGAMLKQELEKSNQLTQQMQQSQNNMVQQNMQNPQVQALYQNYLAQGGTLSFQQFAYNYAATGGFTQEGMARYRQNEQNIQQRDQASLNAYRQNQAQNQQWMQQQHQRNSEIAHQRGNLLNGTSDYIDPNTGMQYNLPHTAQPNTYIQDQNNNQGFLRDGQGNYQRRDQFGNWADLQEDD